MKVSLSFSRCIAVALSSVFTMSVVEALRPEGLEPDMVLEGASFGTDPTKLVFANPSAPNPAEIGMRLLINDPLWDYETKEEVAVLEGLCTLIGFAQAMFPKLYCTGVMDFGDEDIIAVQGTLIQDGNNQTDGVVTIVGGTGIYDAATGWLATTDDVNGTSKSYIYLTNKEADEEVDESVSKSDGERRLGGIGSSIAATLGLA